MIAPEDIDWSIAPKGYDFAFTTGPKWMGSKRLANAVEFALDESGALESGGDLKLEIGDSRWVLCGRRPAKTEKELAVEAALAMDCEPHEGMLSRHDFCEALYDAGMLRLPEPHQGRGGGECD